MVIRSRQISWHLNGGRVLGYGYVAKDEGGNQTADQGPAKRPE